MIKGSNRRMFRKPGRARQAIGILASSKELMDAAQASQMPMQPVQSFANGGFADTAYGLMGLGPPGFNVIGEGDDATLEPISGFGGAYQRLSGIRDPSRARQQSGMDLLELGARIAAGQSTSTTENIANALIPTIDKIGKRREKELATDLAVAQLRDKKEQEARDRVDKLYAAQRQVNLKFSKELSQIGAAVDGTTGLITYGAPVDGKLPVFKDMQGLQAHLRSLGTEGESDLRILTDSIQRAGGTVGERLFDDLTNPDIDLQSYLQKYDLGTDEKVQSPRELKFRLLRLEGAVQDKGGVIIRPTDSAADARILDFGGPEPKVLTPFGAIDRSFKPITIPDSEQLVGTPLEGSEYAGRDYVVQEVGTGKNKTQRIYDNTGRSLDPSEIEGLASFLDALKKINFGS